MRISIKYSLLFLVFFACNNPLTNDDSLNCIIDYNGFFDDCGVCSGGSTGHLANSDMDCNGVCNGTAVLDTCGVCEGDDSSCENACESFGCDGVCDSGLVNDECGICNGNGEDKDLCGICYGENNSCNTGLLTLAEWEFSQFNYWNNIECNGFPQFAYLNHICIDGTCYDYKINFYFDQSDGTLRFNQLNQTWGIDLVENITESSFGGLWYFGDGTSLCLDYDDINLIDSCYEAVDIKNTYFDCENNIQNCINNSISFININEEENSCTIEEYNNTAIEANNNNSIEISKLSPIIRNIILYENE